MGIIGGLLGALFNEFNTVISKYRMKHVAKKRASRILRLVTTICVCVVCIHACIYALHVCCLCVHVRVNVVHRLVEVLLVAIVTTSVVFTLATTLGSCVDKSKVCQFTVLHSPTYHVATSIPE